PPISPKTSATTSPVSNPKKVAFRADLAMPSFGTALVSLSRKDSPSSRPDTSASNRPKTSPEDNPTSSPTTVPNLSPASSPTPSPGTRIKSGSTEDIDRRIPGQDQRTISTQEMSGCS